MAGINYTQKGYRLISGDKINDMIDQINNLTGNGTPGAVTGSTLSLTGLATLSATDAITAHSGGGQSSATLLTTTINRVSTVAAGNDSVKLPVSAAGLFVLLVNGAAVNSMQVFGSGTDTINGVATGTGVAQAAGISAVYFCPVAGKWFRVLSA